MVEKKDDIVITNDPRLSTTHKCERCDGTGQAFFCEKCDALRPMDCEHGALGEYAER